MLALFQAMCAINEYDVDKLHDKVHEIRGEAGTFGYDLVSNIGKLLCELLSPIEEVTEIDQKAISAHLNAMHSVVSQKVKGAVPEVAKQIVEGLTAIVAKSRSAE